MAKLQVIDLGNVTASAAGDFAYQQTQISLSRTLDATAQIALVGLSVAPNKLAAGSFGANVLVSAKKLDVTLTDTTTTLTADMGYFDTSLTYTGADVFSVNQLIVIDTEEMRIDSIDTATNTILSLTRQSEPNTHTAGAVIYTPTDAGITKTAAHWGKTVHFTSNFDSSSVPRTGIVRDLFPATKDPGALTWDVTLGSATATDYSSFHIHLLGQAATTIDWVVRLDLFRYFNVLP